VIIKLAKPGHYRLQLSRGQRRATVSGRAELKAKAGSFLFVIFDRHTTGDEEWKMCSPCSGPYASRFRSTQSSRTRDVIAMHRNAWIATGARSLNSHRFESRAGLVWREKATDASGKSAETILPQAVALSDSAASSNMQITNVEENEMMIEDRLEAALDYALEMTFPASDAFVISLPILDEREARRSEARHSGPVAYLPLH
jgi:hypothetical protein